MPGTREFGGSVVKGKRFLVMLAPTIVMILASYVAFVYILTGIVGLPAAPVAFVVALLVVAMAVGGWLAYRKMPPIRW